MPQSLAEKNVLVLGLGLHGGAIGTIRWLHTQGANIIVSDTKTEKQLASSVKTLQDIPGITYLFGNQDLLDLDGIDIIIRNPGVPRTAPVLQRAKEMGIDITMDSELFFAHSRSANIIGITGSKGKTTTATAIAAVMRAADARTVAVGIDGVSPLGKLEEVRERDTPIVFELSSWRLEPLQEKGISPHVAVCTSLYRDHLNTYASFEEYIATKEQIIRNQSNNDIAILNADDVRIRTWKDKVTGTLYWYSLKPLQEEQMGIWIDKDNIMVNTTHPELACAVLDIPHTAPHELRNKLPAILIGILHGMNATDIIRVLTQTPPLAHRLQFVRTVQGVPYINDSAATMPDATIAALSSFQEKPIILILGGSDKALQFEELADAISQHKHISHIIWLPGAATEHMKEVIIPHTSAKQHHAANMDEAVTTAARVADPGDVVLLSPGATSFGLFLHEFDRGDSFIGAVKAL